jgi:Gram-negative bacterial TonB protein C-terminal
MGTSPTSSTVQWFMRPDRTLGSLPVALEVAVEVSGTRAASDAAKRELFSENTRTTLVFEDGAVVRLSVSVEVGQLLFLKNVVSQQEIVARVLRQRGLGAATAYVELEFSEAVPGFWGELPAVEEEHATGPASLELAAATQFLAEEAAEERSSPVAKLDDGEIARLRDEIAGLRQQMTSLLESGGKPPAPGALPPDLATKLFAVAAADAAKPRVEGDSQDDSHKARQESVADDFFATAALEEKGTAASAEIVEKAPARPLLAGRISLRFVAASLLLVLTGAAYHEGFFKSLAHRGASNVAARPPVGTAGGTLRKNASATAGASTLTDAPVDKTNSAEEAVRRSGDRAAPADESVPKPDAVSLKPDHHRDEPVAKAASTSPATSSTVEIADEEIAPPALLKAANPVAPPEAVRDFVTGDVKCDALVDAKGKVASASVLSGPAPLRQAAIEALRLYQYKPATKNGKAVPAHVEVTLKFWYEP